MTKMKTNNTVRAQRCCLRKKMRFVCFCKMSRMQFKELGYKKILNALNFSIFKVNWNFCLTAAVKLRFFLIIIYFKILKMLTFLNVS